MVANCCLLLSLATNFRLPTVQLLSLSLSSKSLSQQKKNSISTFVVITQSVHPVWNDFR
jgi:hypothetical protein